MSNTEQFGELLHKTSDHSKHAQTYEAEIKLGRIINNGSVLNMQEMIEPDSDLFFLFKKMTYHKSIQTAIGLLNVAKMSAIHGGLGVDSAYTLYDSYLERFNECHSSSDLLSAVYSALLEYTEAVANVHSMTREKYSATINNAITIIADRIPEKISLSQVAAEVHITPKYLSALFIKETGISFSDYVQDIRIQKAKQLLESSDLSLLEITNMLNFSSQSYFNHIFKKKTGMTPKEFKSFLQTR
ncbi:MAG: AraC family transcriptional regulator [Lachnospiraceae bacterium]|nr:AraC family transcriptional regulator [Lachnospiraceae bacterium]